MYDAERSIMAGRRQRKKRSRAAGCLGALVIALCLAAGAAYALPWAAEELGGVLQSVIGDTVERTVSSIQEQQAEFPELSVTVEEVADDFYYQQLNEREQTVYRELLQGINAMEECILLHAGSGEHPEKVYEYLLYDRPELFWCSGSSQMTVYENYTEFYPEYTCGPDEKEQRQAEIDSASSECVSAASGFSSDYEKVKYVFEYLVNTVDYDESAPDNQNIYSALVGKRSVCAGYSRAAQYLLGDLGVECIYVVGNVQGQGAHAWNIVNCGGNYYQMDVTFGDPVFLASESGEQMPGSIINYDYLCCTDEEIMKDHEQSTEAAYPVCTADDLNYYRLNGMYYDSFDSQILLNAMNESVYAGEENFLCRFADSDVYAQARDAMINELIPRAAQNLASAYGLTQVEYSYIDDDVHFKIMVFWNYQ